MKKETVIKLMTKMIEKQTEALKGRDESTNQQFFREGVKSAYEHAIQLVNEVKESDD